MSEHVVELLKPLMPLMGCDIHIINAERGASNVPCMLISIGTWLG